MWLASPHFGLDKYVPSKRKTFYYRNFERDLKYNFELSQKLESNNYIPVQMPKFSVVNDILTDKKVKASERKHQLVVIDAQNTIMAVLPNTSSEVHKISHETFEALAICLKYH